MSPQSKAIQFSLLLHAMLFFAALSLSQHRPTVHLPVALDFTILPAVGPPDAGPSQVAQAVPPAPRPPVPVGKKVMPKPVAKKQPPVEKKRPLEKSKPPVVTVPVTASAPHSQPEESAPTATASTASAAANAGPVPATANGQGGRAHGSVFAASQLDSPLAAIAKAAPVYPPAAKRRNIEGWIKVKFLVDEQGQVDRVSVLDAEPEGVFDQAVLRCISSWRFKPGTKGGIAVKAMVEQTITFKLEG